MPLPFTELTLDDLLADPLVELVMRSDGLTRGSVRSVMEGVRRHLRDGHFFAPDLQARFQ